MQKLLDNHPYIKELLTLEKQYPNRMELHEQSHPLLLKMGNDKDFLRLVVKRNFEDVGFLNHQWSAYNIPFLYVYETDDFVLKIHLFPADKARRTDLVANGIHHHNNYILSTNAYFGSGYECFLFNKKPIPDNNLQVEMKVTKRFHQRDWNPHIVEAWEPHVIIAPDSFSSTLAFWTPDEKRTTDKLRQHPLLKPIKKQLKWLAYRLGAGDKLGVAAENTYQFYAHNGKFVAIKESDYVAPMLADVGPEIDAFSAQMLFYFLQKCEIIDKDYFALLKDRKSTPEYYKTWIKKILNNEDVPEVFHKPDLNIPPKQYFVKDILEAAHL